MTGAYSPAHAAQDCLRLLTPQPSRPTSGLQLVVLLYLVLAFVHLHITHNLFLAFLTPPPAAYYHLRQDLRQDERVMQLFGLVNTMLSAERSTAERDLSIARYAVIPLSPNSGLIGWVPNCDTLHQLIR